MRIMPVCAGAILISGFAGLSAGQAAERPVREWPSAALRTQHKLPPCTCRASGRDYGIGESICLNARRAVCGMSLNVTTWSMTSEICETSALQSHKVVY